MEKTYTIYFHIQINTLEDIDSDDMPNGNYIWDEEQFSQFLNANLKVRFLPDTKINEALNEDFSYNNDQPATYDFECWLDFKAENDKQAKDMVDKVLADYGFDWVSVYYLIERTIFERIVDNEGIVEEDIEPTKKATRSR